MATEGQLVKTFSFDFVVNSVDRDIFDAFTEVYDVRNIGREAFKILSRVSAKPYPGATVDHINNNMFDNRRSNLRWVTQKEQNANRRMFRNNKTGHRGVKVLRNRQGEPWRYCAHLQRKGIAGKNRRLFPYTHEGLIAACQYYDKLAKDHFGDAYICRSEYCRDCPPSQKPTQDIREVLFGPAVLKNEPMDIEICA